ncbi:MAG TPA: hypothetical protein VK325_03720 [Pseudoxanthomonas sp.]|nr:hypothetical protein [Pseudoxanthomonas sp.]
MSTGKKSQGESRNGGKTSGDDQATKSAQKNSSGKSKKSTPASGGNKSGATKR